MHYRAEMQPREPWTRRSRDMLCRTPRLSVWRDEVLRPDGQADTYDWVGAPDLVRVAAFAGDDLLLIEQCHYLVGTTWQLPGGAVDPGDADHRAAAERELREETGFHGGRWTSHGSLHPLPGLSPVRVHLWVARELVPGPPTGGDPGEADLRLRRVPSAEAALAARDGRIGCAASAALVLASAERWPGSG